MGRKYLPKIFMTCLIILSAHVYAADKQYAYTLDYSAVPADIFKKQITINVSVGTASSCNVTADGAAITCTYTAGTGTCSFSLSQQYTNLVVTAVNWTTGGTGAATKATLWENKKWAYSFTFDDCYAADYTLVLPYFSARGLRAGVGVVTNWIGGGQYLSRAQLDALFNANWGILNHSTSHPQSTISCSNLATYIGAAKTTLESWYPTNYKNIYFIYPYLEMGYRACLSTAGYVRGAEGVDGTNYVDTFGSIDFYNLYRHGMYASITTAQANAWADAAAVDARPRWNIVFTHQTYSGSSAPGTYDTNEATLQPHINYVYTTYGEGGATKNMWFAPSDEVLMYLFMRQYLAINTATPGTPTRTPTITPYAGTPTFTVTPTNTPSSILLDDMEDGNVTNNWGGNWYSYSGTGTTITPKPFTMTAGGMTGSPNYRAQIVATVADYAGMGTNLNAAETAVDLTSYISVEFWVKGNGGTYWFQFTQPSITDGDNFGVTFIAPAVWTKVTVPIDAGSLAQRGYGAASTFTKDAITALQWASNANGALDIQVDNVQFLTSVAQTPTNTPQVTQTFTRTGTPNQTATFTVTSTPTRTVTPVNTSTFTATSTPSVSRTSTATYTRTFSVTMSVTPSYTPTATLTWTWTPANSPTSTPSRSATPTFTVTRSITPTCTATNTNTPGNTYTATPSQSPSATSTVSRTLTPTNTCDCITSTFTQTSTYTRTVSPSPSRTDTSTSTPTRTMTSSFTQTNTRTSTPTPSNTFSTTPSITETAYQSPTLTLTGTPPSPTVTPSVSATASTSPSNTYTRTATSTPSWTETIIIPSTTFTPTRTMTLTQTSTVTNTSTRTTTPSYTRTVTVTFTTTIPFTPTYTITRTVTQTVYLSPTITPSGTPPSATVTPSFTQTSSSVPTSTVSASNTATPTLTITASSTATPTSSESSVPSPVFTATTTPTLSPTTTHYPPPTSTPTDTRFTITDPLIYPCPYTGTGDLHVKFTLSQDCRSVSFRLYTVSLRYVIKSSVTWALSGDMVMDIKHDRLQTIANGTYYYVITAKKADGTEINSKINAMIIIK